MITLMKYHSLRFCLYRCPRKNVYMDLDFFLFVLFTFSTRCMLISTLIIFHIVMG